MRGEDLVGRPAVELASLVRSGTVTPAAVVDAHLERIAKLEPLVGAFTLVRAERAAAEAYALGSRPDLAGLPLAGVPVAVKDSTDVAGEPTRNGSRASLPTPARADSELVRRLRAAGCIVIGKTTLPELAVWPFTESSLSGVTRNPWDLARTPGGSSGGSAAAVAAGMTPIALGSDGGGSIRIPAACCGLVGLKPGRGLLPRPASADASVPWYGLSEWGPLATTAADAALMLDVLAGTERFRAARPPERPLRIALSTRSPVRGVKADTGPVAAAEATAELLAQAGHEVEAADPPYPPALVWTFLQRWVAGVAEDAGSYRYELLEPRTQRQVQLGRALRRWRPVRSKPAEAWRNRAVDWFAAGGFDALLTPALAKPPVPVGRWEGSGFVRTMLDATAFVPFTAAWNLAGLPSAAVPAGPPPGGCPLGVMLTAPVGGEGVLLSLTAQLERLRPWPRQAPPPA